jgi:hypothetical protein
MPTMVMMTMMMIHEGLHDIGTMNSVTPVP